VPIKYVDYLYDKQCYWRNVMYGVLFVGDVAYIAFLHTLLRVAYRNLML